MAIRLLSETPYGKLGIKVSANGWSATIFGKDMPMDEIPQKYHAEIRRNVKEVCKLHNWEDMSEL